MASKRSSWGTPLRNRYFTAIRSSSVRTVADRDLLIVITSNVDELFGGINIDDLERPYKPSKYGILVNLS